MLLYSIVRVAWSDSGRWFTTLGYDKTLCIYEVILTPPSAISIDDDEYANTPSFTYLRRWRKVFPTNPEAGVFLPASTHLVFSRRDDNLLHYVRLPRNEQDSTDAEPNAFEVTSYNLNENLDSHISFCV